MITLQEMTVFNGIYSHKHANDHYMAAISKGTGNTLAWRKIYLVSFKFQGTNMVHFLFTL